MFNSRDGHVVCTWCRCTCLLTSRWVAKEMTGVPTCSFCDVATISYLLNQISCNVPHNFEQVIVVKVLFREPEGDILVARGIFAVRLKGR